MLEYFLKNIKEPLAKVALTYTQRTTLIVTSAFSKFYI